MGARFSDTQDTATRPATRCAHSSSRFAAVLRAILLYGSIFALGGCGTGAHTPGNERAADADLFAIPDYSPAEDEFSVMTYNLSRYFLDDRDDDGQRDDPKPEPERSAVLDLIGYNAPDILAVQEIGGPTLFETFKHDLQQRGLTYEFEEHLVHPRSSVNAHMAVLSRLPIVSHQSHLDDVYTIGSHKNIPVARGFIDVDIGVSPIYSFKLMVAHLKSKVFHELGQTEMRRNEARLLNNHVRHALDRNPRLNLLVAGDLNDTYSSAAVREVKGEDPPYLFDIRPADFTGDVWTHFWRAQDEYGRIDYLLVSRPMLPELVREKTRVVRHPLAHVASDHRPLVAVFKARNQTAP